MKYRPKLADVAHLRVVKWYEPYPSDDDPYRLIVRMQEIARWACGGCRASGHFWLGEPLESCPQCGAKWSSSAPVAK